MNILAVLIMGQTNLLTTKGCDSPLVGKVCQVLDTLVVGSKILGTDSEFVDKDYDPTELEDAEITFIDVTGAEKFRYPEGYFAQSNPELAMMNQDGMLVDLNGIQQIPGIPDATTGGSTDLLSTPQQLPQDNPNAITGPLPTSPFSFGGDTSTMPPSRTRVRRPRTPRRTPKVANDSPSTLPDLNSNQVADANANKAPVNANTNTNQAPVKSDPVAEVEINKKPLQDLAAIVLDKLAKKEVDLNRPFLVTMDGTLTKDGKLDKDPAKSRFTRQDGDEQMVNVAKEAIERIGDSGWFGYLKNLGVEKVNFTLYQDDKQIYAILTSDQKTEQRAQTVASGLNGIISIAKMNVKGEDEKKLLEGASVANKGNTFVLNFIIPKQEAQAMINRKLEEAKQRKEEEEKQKRPIGTAGQNSRAGQAAAR